MDKKLIIKNSSDKEEEYRILFEIKTDNEDKSFIIYTDDKKFKDGSYKTYVSVCKYNQNKKITTLEDIKSEKELKLIERILNSIQKESEL